MKYAIILIVLIGILSGCAVQAVPQCDYSAYTENITRLENELSLRDSAIQDKDKQIAQIQGQYDQLVAQNGELRSFKDTTELIQFLAADKTDLLPYVPGSFVCSDFALTLMKNANKKGFIFGLFPTTKNGENHMQNTTMVGSDLVYIVEPQDDSLRCISKLSR